MSKITQSEIAEIFKTTQANISIKSKKNPTQFEVIELGAICKKYNIDKKTLFTLIKMHEWMQ